MQALSQKKTQLQHPPILSRQPWRCRFEIGAPRLCKGTPGLVPIHRRLPLLRGVVATARPRAPRRHPCERGRRAGASTPQRSRGYMNRRQLGVEGWEVRCEGMLGAHESSQAREHEIVNNIDRKRSDEERGSAR